MVQIQEVILVEGRYDKNTLSQIIDGIVIECGGFAILKDKEKIELLRIVAKKRGLVIFTDSDGAGFVIRNRLKSLLAPAPLLHAYIPDIPGKECRKRHASKEGMLGVEGMSPEIILESLRRSGAHLSDSSSPQHNLITRQDLYNLGLMGCTNSTQLRNALKKRMNLPQHMGTSAFLDALNLITDPEALYAIVASLQTPSASSPRLLDSQEITET